MKKDGTFMNKKENEKPFNPSLLRGYGQWLGIGYKKEGVSYNDMEIFKDEKIIYLEEKVKTFKRRLNLKSKEEITKKDIEMLELYEKRLKNEKRTK